MTLLWTLLMVAVPYFLMFGLALHFWNDERETWTGPIGYAAVVVVAVLLWQGAWEYAS